MTKRGTTRGTNRAATNVIVLAGLAGVAGWGTAHWLALDPAAALAQRQVSEKSDFDTLHEGLQISGYVRDEVMAQGGSAIPVLIPWEMTRDAATARAHRFALKIAPDGYTALLGDDTLDYVINGTDHGYSRSDSDAKSSADSNLVSRPGLRPGLRPDPGHENPDREDGDYMMPYEDFDDGRGGSLAFGFRGADYQVELYCLAEAPDPEANCLEAAMVERFVRGLMGH